MKHPVEDKFSCILRYTFVSLNFELLLHKNEIKNVQDNKNQFYALHLINISFFLITSNQRILPQCL